MASVKYTFPSLNLSLNAAPEQITQYRLIVGSAREETLEIGADLASIESLSTRNGNLSWGLTDGSTLLVTSNIDYIQNSEETPYYMNINTENTATIGRIIDEKSRAVVSYEWLDAYNAGTLTLTYENLGGGEALDTVIEGAGGTVVLADYNLEERLDDIVTIGTIDGGILIDFSGSASA